MELKGKLKEDFYDWFIRQDTVNNTEHRMLCDKHLSKTAINAHIVNFLDYIGYTIEIRNCCNIWSYEIKNITKNIISNETAKTREKIIEKAIRCVNRLYN